MEIREFETRVINVRQMTRDIKSIRFSAPQDIDFEPGQFFVLTIKIKGEEAAKHFSISNSPAEKGYIEFAKRITSSEFSNALDLLKAGDWARIKLPYGLFTFKGEYEKIALLTGGIGITAIRSMCKFATDKRLATNIILIYANRTENDIAFKEELSEMQKENKNLKVVHVLTHPMDEDAWKGRKGHINAEMVKEEIPDYGERTFYICGPPRMVESLKPILLNDLKLDKKRLRWEHFLGY
ncbi:MAG: FAD-dependent oxidoreductase [Nitrospirae bacterium]|nr:FAD-dependent oxidoreductase [Nitrospirota bacterium]